MHVLSQPMPHKNTAADEERFGRHRNGKSQKDLYRSNELFRRIASKTAHGVGHPLAFVLAVAAVAIWGLTGKLFNFSDTWQLVINTGTTIVTFLTVFLIQNTQNRDSHAIHLKLNELIRANRRARNRMIALEELPEHELDALQEEFDRRACARVASRRRRRELDQQHERTSPASIDAE